MTDRLHFHDPTSAMRRPQVITHFGPGDDDKLPERIRPLLSQAIICGVGWVFLFATWGLLWRDWFTGRLIGDYTAVVVCFVAPVIAARYHRKFNLDGRSVFRSGRAELAHRVQSGGRSVGRWHVHGQPVPQNRRRPKPVKPVMVPAEEAV